MKKKKQLPPKSNSSGKKFIYLFKLANGYYIGKYANKQIYKYHLQRASPLFIGYTNSVYEDSDAWERKWQIDINEKGLANSSYVQGMSFYEYKSIEQKLRESMENYASKEYVELIFKFIKQIWKQKGNQYYEIVEALMIMLAKNDKDMNLKNTQIDFMGRDIFINGSNRAWFDEKELERKLRTYVDPVGDWYTRIEVTDNMLNSPQDFLQHIISEEKINNLKAGDKISIKLDKKHNWNKINEGYKKVTKKVLGLYGKTRAQQLKNKLKYFNINKKNKNELITEIDTLANETNYDSAVQQLDNIQHKINTYDFMYQKKLNEYENKVGIKYQQFIDFINNWFDNVKFDQIIPINTQGISEDNNNSYKEDFTNAMQKVFKGNSFYMKNSENIQKEAISYIHKFTNWKNNNWTHDDYGGGKNFINDNINHIWVEQILINKGMSTYNNIKYY